MSGAPVFVCHGCGAKVDAAKAFPFGCPNARADDDVDHVLVAPGAAAFTPPTSVRGFGGGDAAAAGEADPFLRYRGWLSPYHLALAAGLPDAAWVDLVGELDAALIRVDGRGFRITPFARQPALAQALGLTGDLWIKDETHNVSGSHKGRHLMGLMLYLRVLERAGLPLGEDLRKRRLAIASCGNAALAAAVIARAADWPLDVFIPTDAEASVVRRLADLGARAIICERNAGGAGDPCVHAVRSAVAAGAIPFGVQGPDNGLAVEGVRTLAFEIAEALPALDALYVQVGGGALASALAQGFDIAVKAGLAARAPRLIAVQTEGCAPLVRAWERLEGVDLAAAALNRKRFMWPWETTPHSLAHGILDDETYDWWEIAKAILENGGGAVVVTEAAVARAFELARQHTEIRTSATGSAGLAGALVAPITQGTAAAILSGIDRS